MKTLKRFFWENVTMRLLIIWLAIIFFLLTLQSCAFNLGPKAPPAPAVDNSNVSRADSLLQAYRNYRDTLVIYEPQKATDPKDYFTDAPPPAFIPVERQADELVTLLADERDYWRNKADVLAHDLEAQKAISNQQYLYIGRIDSLVAALRKEVKPQAIHQPPEEPGMMAKFNSILGVLAAIAAAVALWRQKKKS